MVFGTIDIGSMNRRVSDYLDLLDRMKSGEEIEDWREGPDSGQPPSREKTSRRRSGATVRNARQFRDSEDRPVTYDDWE